jgi:2-polyprenyl-3-methyl-5-hydroxy-6-metoxy-1,4-benzoquinol methylase
MQPLGFSSWEELYRNDTVEKLPWYWPTLDPDLQEALRRRAITSGRALDQGTGPGTQAIALAQLGFTVTAADVSPAAIAYAERKAKAAGAQATFVQDDVLATRLAGPFDVVFDRGCFHVLEGPQRDAYVQTMRKLVAPSGWLFLKTFSHRQPGDFGPHRFAPEQLRTIFGGSFEVVEILDTVYQGQLDPFPLALFATMRVKPETK